METILTILIPVTYLSMLVLERLFPRARLPVVRGWVWKGLLFFVLGGALNTAVPALVASALGEHTLLHLAPYGLVFGAVAGALAADLGAYFVHRAMHNVHFLWRWTHQMHHSAERLDMAGAVYFHPFDIVLQGGAASLATLLLGLSPDAAALAGFLGFFTGMFQHMNIRTPQWLGYLIQRPEAHGVHHARGLHAYNYASFGIWDILFGTFRNPATFEGPTGFWHGASSEVGSMLIGRDVASRERHVSVSGR